MTPEFSPELVKTLEDKGRAIAETLQRALTSVEAISDSARNFFSTLQRQKDSIVEIGQMASSTLSPVLAPIGSASVFLLGRGVKSSGALLRKTRARPMPYMVGGVVLLGGLALLAHYAQKSRDKVNHEQETIAA